MAKKVRRPPEEEAAAFEFPTFDERRFLTKEYELAVALALATSFAVVAGVASWAATFSGLPWYVPFPIGLLYVALSYFVIVRLRPKSELYTKGDWAGLLAIQFFAWVAVWFLLVNLT